jgi:putrescine transport system substrate-binding protein
MMQALPVWPVLLLIAACGETGSPGRAAGDAPPAATGDAVVNFANFVEEIAPTTVDGFTAETGIRVNYDTYETNLALEARLVVGSTGFDVVVPGNNFLERQIAAGVYRKLDKSKLPNLRHLDPAILAQLERNDPGNQYAVPYLWGTTGLGYNVRQVEAALGGPAPDSWALIFDPEYAAKLAGCGISLVDSPWLMTGFALLYLGRDPNSESLEDLEAAMQVLTRIRPYVRDISGSLVSTQLAEGEFCVAVAPSSDFRIARDIARHAKRDTQLRYIIPREGAILWIDTLAIPVDAPHPDNAHRLIDHLMRPDVAAEITEAVYFANANASASTLVADEVRNDPTIYPDEATMGRLHMNAALSAEYTRAQNRAFERFRSGR